MSGLLNTANKRISYITFEPVAGESSAAVTVRVTAAAGARLLSGQSDSVVLKVRESGSGDPYVDLSAGVDLSGYTPGASIDFDLICEASEELTGLVRVALFLGVVNSGGAAWAG
ncbi:MAG TPA: hypothetical protein VF762_14330 [Blastocatellia bacterium]|jgi:phage tail sheath gpL-like